MVSEVWRIKPGTVERRDSWIRLTDALMKIQTPKFDVSSRAVRELFTNLMSKRKAKNREEEAGSGISPEPSEADTLLDEPIDIFQTADLEHKAAANERKGNQAAEIAKAQEMRQQSVETLGESRKRRLGEEGGKGSKRRNEEETYSLLREKMETDTKMKVEKLQLRKKELEEKVKYREQLLREKRRRYDEGDIAIMFGEIRQQLQQQNDLLMRIVAKQEEHAQILSHICEEMKKNINEYLHLLL